MNIAPTRVIGMTLLAIAFCGATVQTADDAPQADLTAETRRAVIDSISRTLIDGYIYEDTARKMAAALKENLDAGRYDKLTSAPEFAVRLTEDLQKVKKDRHLGIRFETSRPAAAPKTAGKQRRRLDPKDINYGFARVEVLEGNLGYLDLHGFIGIEGGIARADAAMALLADVKALIIDLGHNTGGDETMVKYLSTYLFDAPTHLVDTFARGMDKPRERWTLKEVPNKRLSKIPVYVLVSRRTISASESFTFGLSANKRVTVVGEQTGGGGHFGGVEPLVHGFSVWLPRGRTYDPRTGEGWEATGIKPDIEVPYDKALAAAIDHAKRQVDK